MQKNTTYATPASLLAKRSSAIPSGTDPSGTSHYIESGTHEQSAHSSSTAQRPQRHAVADDLPSLTVKAWLAHADKYERPARERVIAAAVGRAQARYANIGIFPVEWNGENARLFVATPDTVEVVLAETRIRTTTENEARFIYLQMARPEILRYSFDYCLAYESERIRENKPVARDVPELRREATEKQSLEGKLDGAKSGAQPEWGCLKDALTNKGRGCA